MGLPPSGAYVAKKLFTDAAAATGLDWLKLVLDAGAFLTAGYTVLVLAHALRSAPAPLKLEAPPPRVAEMAALALAIASLLLGFVAAGRIPSASLAGAFTPASLGSALIVIAGGAALAVALGLRLPLGAATAAALRPLRKLGEAAGGLLVRADGALRQWPVAMLTLLALAFALAAAIAARG
jgi:hypothetical protein